MRNLIYFGYFQKTLKPERLIFQEKPAENQKSPPSLPIEIEKDFKAKVEAQENKTLAYQRILALEEFRNIILKHGYNFTGFSHHKTSTEILQDEALQYAYTKLNEFFKKNTDPKWPIDLQQRWMREVALWVAWNPDVDDVDKKIVDKLIEQVSDAPSRGYTPPGTFSAWLFRRDPAKFIEVFGELPKHLQNPE